MDKFSRPHLVFGLIVLFGYLFVESRGMVFGDTDGRPSPSAWVSGPRSSGWGYSSGHFGGK